MSLAGVTGLINMTHSKPPFSLTAIGEFMRKRTKVFLTLTSVIFLVCTIWFIFGSTARGRSTFTPSSLEEKARKAKNGDEAAVRDLADEVFYRYGPMLPTEVADKVKERLVRAEVEYKKNGKGSVREMDVVRSVNFLAEKFSAPDFVKTDLRQVKMLRAKMRLEQPSFFAPEPGNKRGLKKKLGEPMNQEVSPIEATCLTMVMLTQKALNDEYQQTPEQFAIRASRKPLWLERDSDKSTMTVNDPRNIEKTRAVIRAVESGAKRLSPLDALNLADETLDKLGIKK
jgi:stalled ribosome alternative rescue factor ArfA